MSGHSKWSTIKRKKGKIDQERGKIFSKLVREIQISAKQGADPAFNTRLRLAIQKAKEANMPADNIKRAIQKGSSQGDSNNLEEIIFEAYGPFGVALLINVVTDNRNRTIPNIKSILTRANGSLASKGAVSYLFDKKGIILFEPGTSEDEVINIVLEYNIENIETKEDSSIEVIMDPSEFEVVKQALDTANFAYANAQISMVPKTTVQLNDEQVEKIEKLIETLEDDEDIQEVYSNYD